TCALTASADRTVRLWDLEGGRELLRFDGHKDKIWAVAYSPDERHALSGSMDNTVRLWDLRTGREVRRFVGHTGVVKSLAFSPDGKRALSGSAGEFRSGKWSPGTDHTVRLW